MTDRELMQMALDALEAALSNDQPYISRSEETAEALRARLAQPEQEIDPDRPHVEDDGCPTEKAVLQRFWREHQKQESVRLQCVTCGTIYADGVPPQVAQPKQKLWLWKNFVDGRPEYWAFDNPYPTNLDNGDPQTLGQPCGYAIFKPSRDGSRGRTEEQVLREMESVSARSEREWQGLTDEEYEAMAEKYVTNYFFDTLKYARAIEAKLKEKNNG
jgi:hypothetical protein